MRRPSYNRARTGLLIVDPYKDFLCEGGKLWPRIRAVAEDVNLLANLRRVLAAARLAGVQVFYVPHHRWLEADYDNWKFPTPSQLATDRSQAFATGSWGGEWHADLAPQACDVVVREHWGQNGFLGTDLDFQLRQRDVEKVILIGMLANTCVEATARHAAELGYHVTLVRDATAAFDEAGMHAAHEASGPYYAHAIISTDDVVMALEFA
ncbi:cysteine hydrolase family protein [Radicibacter daui]|uniref:cysteine hydrolase family protein n=1 Tax=Radicibacter daui TaxID=3064829 RepID=UPI004046CC05